MTCEYNDHICPALPGGIPEDRPYTLILYHSGTFRFFLLCADSPFFAKTVDGAPVIALDPDTQLYVFVWTITDADWVSAGEVDVSELEVAQNQEWLYFTPGKIVYVWTNTDITDGSDNVVYAASDPVPIIETDYLMSWLTGYILGITGKPYPFGEGESQKWKTVFEGEVTTVFDNIKEFPRCPLEVHIAVIGKRSGRITINGVIYHVLFNEYPSLGLGGFGNIHLVWPDKYADDGRDFAYQYGGSSYFYTRTPGTYKLKIERSVE